MKYIKVGIPVIVAFMFLISGDALARQRPLFVQPRIFVGAEGGYFCISLNRFENVYKDRWGPIYGAHAGVNVFSVHYLTFKYRHFEQSGKEGIHPESGKDLSLAKWREDWFTLGLRIQPRSDMKWNSYYGFGYAFFSFTEKAGLSVYNEDRADSKRCGGGFYLELGIERYLCDRASVFVEFEVSSGGIGGRAGLEGQSIGGYCFSGGIVVWIF
jgi:hypothetical protein